MLIKKRSSVIILTPIIFLVGFLFASQVNAQDYSISPSDTPSMVCQQARSVPGASIILNSADKCIFRIKESEGGITVSVTSTIYFSGGDVCIDVEASPYGGQIYHKCVHSNQASSAGKTTAQPKTIQTVTKTATKGKYYKENISKELIALFDPEDRADPQIYSYTLDTMSGFPPMGIIFKPDGTLEGTPTGKDSKFRACASVPSGKKVCKVIDMKVNKEETDKPELVSSEPFKLTEWAYEGLTLGNQIPSGINERVVVRMPDGSLMQMDKNSAFTPISEYEVKTDEGRFNFEYKPAKGGSCGPIGQSPTWACRQVDTRDAILRVKGTEFSVDTDKYGTNIVVEEGVLLVSDAKGKKTIEVAGGQYAYIKKGDLPAKPQSFDLSQVDNWWDKKESNSGAVMMASVLFFFFTFFVLSFVVFKIFKKRGEVSKTVPAAGNSVQETNKKSKPGCMSCVVAIVIFFASLSLAFVFYLTLDIYLENNSGSQPVKEAQSEKTTKTAVCETEDKTYFEIKELGVKFLVSKDIKDDLIYKYDSKNGAYLSAKSLVSIDAGCSAENGPLGAISKIEGTPESVDKNAEYYLARKNAIKQFDGFFIFFEGPQAICALNKKNIDQADDYSRQMASKLYFNLLDCVKLVK